MLNGYDREDQMRISMQTIAVPLLLAFLTFPAWAGIRPTPISRSAPGPVIGMGLPAMAACGVYVWIRRRHLK